MIDRKSLIINWRWSLSTLFFVSQSQRHWACATWKIQFWSSDFGHTDPNAFFSANESSVKNIFGNSWHPKKNMINYKKINFFNENLPKAAFPNASFNNVKPAT